MKVINLSEIIRRSELFIEDEEILVMSVGRNSEELPSKDHHIDCPVYHNASICCVWPIAICVPDDYEFPKLKGLVINED